jgi:hypothetical protein
MMRPLIFLFTLSRLDSTISPEKIAYPGAYVATMMTADTATGDEMTGDRNGLCHVSH